MGNSRMLFCQRETNVTRRLFPARRLMYNMGTTALGALYICARWREWYIRTLLCCTTVHLIIFRVTTARLSFPENVSVRNQHRWYISALCGRECYGSLHESLAPA